MNDACTGQLQLLDEGILLLDRERIAFHQSVTVCGNIAVAGTLAIQGVEADPRSPVIRKVTKDLTDVPTTGI